MVVSHASVINVRYPQCHACAMRSECEQVCHMLGSSLGFG